MCSGTVCIPNVILTGKISDNEIKNYVTDLPPQVAFDRYFRICKLGQQFSVRKAKLLCLMSVTLGVLTSWPSCLLFGRKTLLLHVPHQPHAPRSHGDSLALGQPDPGHGAWRGGERVLTANDCSTEDSMRGTIYPTIYYLFLFTLFFLTVAFFAVLYIRIGVAIWRRKRKIIGSKPVFTKVSSQVSVVLVCLGEAQKSDVDDNSVYVAAF